MIHLKPKSFFMFLGLICIVSSARPTLADDSLEANVQSRLQKVEALRKDYDKAIAEFAGTPEIQKISASKAKYAMDQYSLWLDAQSRADKAEGLLAAQKSLMDGCNKEIEPLIHSIPAVTKMEDINRQIAEVDQEFAATRGRVVNAVQAARDVQDISDRVTPLKERATALQAKIVELQNMVNGQKDADVKAHNQGLLDKAGALMKDLQDQIDALNKASATANAHLADATGIADRQQALAAIERIRAGWNRASRKRDEALAALSELRDIRIFTTASVFGDVSVQTVDGKIVPVVSGQEIVLKEGEFIRTGPNSGVTMRNTDGSREQLGQYSSFTEQHTFFIDGRRYYRNPKLNGGWFHDNNLILHGEPRYIRAGSVNTGVRGTDYMLYTDEKETRCYLASGEVELTATVPGAKPVTLKPMQRATLKAGEADWKIEPLTADEYERLLSSLDPAVN